MTARHLLVLPGYSLDRLGIRDPVSRGTQMDDALQLTMATGVADLVLITFTSQATFTDRWKGHPCSS